jgi:hypothetical protein
VVAVIAAQYSVCVLSYLSVSAGVRARPRRPLRSRPLAARDRPRTTVFFLALAFGPRVAFLGPENGHARSCIFIQRDRKTGRVFGHQKFLFFCFRYRLAVDIAV